jgi:hypothetical protein
MDSETNVTFWHPGTECVTDGKIIGREHGFSGHLFSVMWFDRKCGLLVVSNVRPENILMTHADARQA